MAEILNKRSDQVQVGGIPIIPLASQLKYGELVINYANGAETLFLKNNNNQVVSFSNDNTLIKYIDSVGIEYIAGTQTETTANWTGVSKAKELTVGKTIAYYLPHSSASGVTLNLTLADGNETGEIPVYFTGTSRMTTHYAAGSVIVLTYIGSGGWRHADRDTNSTYSVMSLAELKTGTATTARSLSAARLKEAYNINNRTITIGNESIEIPEEKLSENYQQTYVLEAGDTYEEAFEKLEESAVENEITVSQALNVLNNFINNFSQSINQLNSDIEEVELVTSSALNEINQNFGNINNALAMILGE